MNRIPSRGRLLKRLAALTATAVGAAFLAAPSAQAQTTASVDCDALASPPAPASIAVALETAMTCDVEVRVSSRAFTHSTVYATPEGQLHLVATAGPALPAADGTYIDRTLVVKDGTLTHATASSTYLKYTDATDPLLLTGMGMIDWSGDTPVPSYSGAAALYDELAAGLDFAVDFAKDGTELRFTAADADAWTALATGLTAAPRHSNAALSVADGALHWDVIEGRMARQWSTPFTVRDAAGNVEPVTLALGEGGALTLGLTESALATANYPIELSTQLGISTHVHGTWGAVTSAAPELAVLSGEAGLDQPYFEAAGETGDAVAGPYCDKLVDPTCAAEAQASSYWGFRWPDLQQISSSEGHQFHFQAESATFRIDAAEGASCVAPDLDRVDDYSPAVTWADRPTVVGEAVSGTCADGAAIYDVSAPVGSAWGGPEREEAVAFAMTDSAETARFDGASARLDVYIDTVGFYYLQIAGTATVCNLPYGVTTDSTPNYGNFPLRTWRPDLIPPGLTWSATFTRADTGAVVFESAPVAASGSSVSSVSIPAARALADGEYFVAYTFTSTTTGVVYRPSPCSATVDTKAPRLVSVEVEDGPYYVGEPVEVEVTVADEGFPNQNRTWVAVDCTGIRATCSRESTYLSDTTTTTITVTPQTNSSMFFIDVRDAAGSWGGGKTTELSALTTTFDYNEDSHDDLFTVKRATGQLTYHAGNGDGTFDAGVAVASGWGGVDMVMAGDLTGDGFADLLARDPRTGTLYTYPGNGKGGLGSRITVGTGWNALSLFTSAGDYNGDRKIDLLAVGSADGKLYLYPGKGDGTFAARTVAGSGGWNAMDTIATSGDMDGNGTIDLLARTRDADWYYIYWGDGDGTFDLFKPMYVPSGLGDADPARTFRHFAAGGDYNGDGYGDLLAIDARNGQMVLRSFDNGFDLHPGQVIGTGWNAHRLPTTEVDRTYEYTGDGRTDVLATRTSDSWRYIYPGNGKGGFSARDEVGALPGMNLYQTAGDMTGDGNADLLVRTTGGVLYVYKGDGYQGVHYERVTVGAGWNAMSTIIGGQDYNSDDRVDVLAVEKSTGYLWLYPGKGNGTVGSRVKIGTGWNAMREITAVGDLDHDGHADVIAIRGSDNCMYFYGGRGDGTLKPAVKTSCNWVGYDSVTAVGDFNGDGQADWLARRKSDGALYLYKGNGAGGYSARVMNGTGWNAMTLA
ncbi:VCBS repeat-containing protein [Glycomyces luteolus]|uniref:VCBS repeat-containing protein n=1 Tax=Glycomyces luteolus TaxID=2670330 RepID=A0A9X3PB93_9ACTN|nr:VCBS repeat-containing protein [Glycomyces luteolus]MDA1362223.1 VCBS repeat-containing protein [Glycomyces luteolus]